MIQIVIDIIEVEEVVVENMIGVIDVIIIIVLHVQDIKLKEEVPFAIMVKKKVVIDVIAALHHRIGSVKKFLDFFLV